ncbi:MAG: Hsp20/alpha crystallin family protein [Gemmatimonadota bacterium]
MLTSPLRRGGLTSGARAWDPFTELDQLQHEMTQLFERGAHRWPSATEYPPLNVHASDDDVAVTAELPGWEPAHIDVSVVQNSLTIRGNRPEEQAGNGKVFHRRERRSGSFVRTLELPFAIAAENVQAEFRHGILAVTLPRAAEHKPKRIEIKAQ